MLVGNKSDLRPEVEISQVKVCVVSVPTLHVNNMLILYIYTHNFILEEGCYRVLAVTAVLAKSQRCLVHNY